MKNSWAEIKEEEEEENMFTFPSLFLNKQPGVHRKRILKVITCHPTE